MEALLEDLFSVSVSSTPNSVVQPHPKYSELKRRSKEASQELRRQGLLQEQKRLRGLSFDVNRNLEEVITKTRRPLRSIHKDKYKMMHSEWLVDIPSDMTTKWKMLLCPEGRRVLVIAVHGTTKIMTRRRQCVGSFDSVLPGGSPDSCAELTVLDCIMSAQGKTLYVLDMLCWAHHDIVDCEAEFRFFWLQCKFQENSGMTDRELNQGYMFVFLEPHACEPVLIEASMSRYPPFADGPKLDGVLFYHMEASYMMGQTNPLVGWLKGYMVPDLLGVPVAPEYLESRPPGLTLPEHIKVEEKLMSARRNQNRKQKRGSNKMECDSNDTNTEVSEATMGEESASEVAATLQSCKAESMNLSTEPTVSEQLMTM